MVENTFWNVGSWTSLGTSFDRSVRRNLLMVARRFTTALLFILLAVLAFPYPSCSQDVRATARLDSNHILIGDWLTLHIDVEHPENIAIVLPLLPDTFSGIEVVRRDKPTTVTSAQGVKEFVTFVITAFDSGMHIVPPMQIQYLISGDTTRSMVQTQPVIFMVGSITVDTSKEIKDIKPPLSVSITFADILPYLIGIIVIAGVAWLIFYIRKKKKKGEPLIPEPPPRPAHVVALEALRALESEQLWQRGLIKEYYSQLTDILRVYIERRFSVMAMEMTSDELLSAAEIASLQATIKEPLRDVLLRADLVKFAKFLPTSRDNESSIHATRGIVEVTSQPAETQVIRDQAVEATA